jgi:two-component system phosphate regulon sensor histidine kinase PhoR
MWRSRMFWRLFGWQAGLLLAAIGLLGLVIYGRVQNYHLQHVEDRLRARAEMLSEVVRAHHDEPARNLQERIRALGHRLDTRLTVIDDAGRVLADSQDDPNRMENHAHRPEVQVARTQGFGASTRFSTTAGESMSYVALRVDRPGLSPAFVRVALPLDRIEEELAALRNLIWTAVAATALGAMALTFWLARRIVHPLQELTAGAERIAGGGYGHKVYAGSGDEVGTLAHTFNHMSERLAEQFAQMDADRQQLRAILSGMVEGVIALDADQRILFANDRAVQLLDLQGQPAVGRKLWEVSRRRALQKVVRRALTEVETCAEDLSWNGPPARNLTVHATRLQGTPARGAVLVLHDTSELRRLERLRQDFVANVSHELKTPLSVITACVETLLDGAVDDAGHRGPFLEQIADQADHLHSLILDLLSLARIESGTEAFALQPVTVAEAVAACLERHRARAEARGQALEAVPPAAANANGEGAVAWADEEAFGQIVDNLVDNAVKYTPVGGRIRVHWRTEGEQVLLEVEDTGIGIPERDLPRIFERFYRVDKARSRELGGTGLGLSIVKHLVQAMHGSVRATSRLGEGTTFQVRLPRAPAD